LPDAIVTTFRRIRFARPRSTSTSGPAGTAGDPISGRFSWRQKVSR
jgi:hypothetical protein